MKMHLMLIFLGISEEFITTLFYFYRRMSELNISNTEYALLAATAVFFSGKNHLAAKAWIKFGNESMKFVVIIHWCQMYQFCFIKITSVNQN